MKREPVQSRNICEPSRPTNISLETISQTISHVRAVEYHCSTQPSEPTSIWQSLAHTTSQIFCGVCYGGCVHLRYPMASSTSGNARYGTGKEQSFEGCMRKARNLSVESASPCLIQKMLQSLIRSFSFSRAILVQAVFTKRAFRSDITFDWRDGSRGAHLSIWVDFASQFVAPSQRHRGVTRDGNEHRAIEIRFRGQDNMITNFDTESACPTPRLLDSRSCIKIQEDVNVFIPE